MKMYVGGYSGSCKGPLENRVACGEGNVEAVLQFMICHYPGSRTWGTELLNDKGNRIVAHMITKERPEEVRKSFDYLYRHYTELSSALGGQIDNADYIGTCTKMGSCPKTCPFVQASITDQ